MTRICILKLKTFNYQAVMEDIKADCK